MGISHPKKCHVSPMRIRPIFKGLIRDDGALRFAGKWMGAWLMGICPINNHYIGCIWGWLWRVPSQGYHHFPYGIIKPPGLWLHHAPLCDWSMSKAFSQGLALPRHDACHTYVAWCCAGSGGGLVGWCLAMVCYRPLYAANQPMWAQPCLVSFLLHVVFHECQGTFPSSNQWAF